MFQQFDATSSPEQGPPRLTRLRAALAAAGLAGFIIPRADAHQGEYVAARDERLQWLTGFTGSAGFCIVLPDLAGVFIDGRYRTQVKAQVDLAAYTPVPWPEVKPGDWVKEKLAKGVVGFDPWLHTAEEIERLQKAVEGTGVSFSAVSGNPVDAIWPDQPAAPMGKAFAHPVELAGESHADKRARLAEGLRKAGQTAAVVTLPDSISWLLNIRGADVPKNPVLHGFAVLRDDGRVDLFVNPAKLDDAVRAHLGPEVAVHPVEGFAEALKGLEGPVRVDKGTAPLAVAETLRGRGGGGCLGRRSLPPAQGLQECGRDRGNARGALARWGGDGGVPALAG